MKEQTGNNNKYGKQSFGGGYHVWKNSMVLEIYLRHAPFLSAVIPIP